MTFFAGVKRSLRIRNDVEPRCILLMYSPFITLRSSLCKILIKDTLTITCANS